MERPFLLSKSKIFLLYLVVSVLFLTGFTPKTSLNQLNFSKSELKLNSSFNEFLDVDILTDPDSTETIDSLGILSDSLMVDSLLADSLLKDSVEAVDSMALDSTARIEHFRYQRKDDYTVDVTEKRKPSWFAQPRSSLLKRSVDIDSTGQYVIIKEEVAGKEMKNGLKIPLSEYIKMKIETNQRDEWEEIGYKYELKDTKTGLSELITDITNIEIPLPSSKILSIFGKPEIKLRINGSVDIYGAWRSETKEGFTASRLGNTTNEPDFKQTVQINVNGTIGDKLSINADWNTERDFEYQNQLKIKYTGYEDEIIKSIEAGNVSLQTSGLVGGSEALFGIKAEFQLGPFNLIALASQKKGETEVKDITSGSSSQTFEKHLYEYSKNHFFIDDIYARTDENYNIFNRYYGNTTFAENNITTYHKVLEIEVYKTLKGDYNPNEVKANAYIDLDSLSTDGSVIYGDELRVVDQEPVTGETVINSRFIKLEPGLDYEINSQVGFLTFKTQILKDEAIAVAYRIEGNQGSTDFVFGEMNADANAAGLDSGDVRVLKLVKPENLKPGDEKAWKLQLKNIYPIGGRDLNEEGFTFDIVYEFPGQDPQNNYEGVSFLEAFGLDKYNDSKTGEPDGKFDFEPGRTINKSTGEIIFPTLQPFGEQFPVNEGLPENIKYQSIYDTTDTYAKQDKEKDKFLLVGEYSAASTSSYSIGFNVVENSVKVLLGGRELKAGVDYRVDYNIGQVTIVNPDALVPGANLKITYEQNDLFSMASKTLFGFRGLYEFNEQTKLGFSFLNSSQKTLSEKVRIGEEPMSNSIFGVDFMTEMELPFITKALDNVISTRAKSSISFKGEMAYINPTPNTKESEIKSDDNKSIAYIDDFEGSKRIIPIGVHYNTWRDMSPPIGGSGLYNGLKANELINKKGFAWWYNIPATTVTVQDIWGDRKKVARDDQQVTVLEFKFDPTRYGTYNSEPDLDNTNENWGGIMKTLSSTASNLVEENIEFIEFWLKVEEAPQDGSFYLDLGKISEDVIPNGILDEEDKNDNDRYDDGEDTGLDGIRDNDEEGPDAADPAKDNFDRNDFERWNGTEGNSNMAELRIPDSEDLDNDGSLDILNSFFRYKVDLDTSKINNEYKNPMIAGGGFGGKGWYQFRIPLKDRVDSVGRPSLSDVDMVRIWVNDTDQPVYLRFVEMNLVGNQWQKVLVPGKVDENDEVLTVSTISYEENPEYKRPPGVEQERDLSKPDEEVYKNEQSLKLSIDGLEDGDKREIVKYLYRPLDVFNYKQMKLFVHGDERDIHPDNISHYLDEHNYAAEVYFRFGTDTSNFYEYRQPVRADWNEIAIIFDELTAIKETRDTNSVLFTQKVEGKPGHRIGVKGEPSLTKISYFTFGIVNPKDKGRPNNAVSGDIWINELRALEADDQSGIAYKFSTSMRLADLMTVNFNMSKTDPYFHTLSSRFGSRTDKESWGANVDFDILKLIPTNLTGSNLKINYRHNESFSTPLYLPGTDVKVDKAAEQLEKKLINEQGVDPEEAKRRAEKMKTETQTVKISDTWSLSNIKIKIPSEAWYFKHTINSLSFAFNYNKSVGRSPSITKQQRWVWNFKLNYNLKFDRDNFFYPANIPIFGSIIELFSDYRNAKVYFTPQSFSASMSAKRNWSYSKSRNKNAVPKIQRDFKATRNFSFNWKITEGGFLNIETGYKANFSSSLAHLLLENGIERSENEIWNDIFSGEYFGRDYDFSQSFDFKLKPQLPSLWNLNRYLSFNFSYSVNYNWKNNFQQPELGRQAGYQNRINAGMSLKLSRLFQPLFAESKSSTSSRSRRRGAREVKPATDDEDGEKKDGEKKEGEEEVLELDEGDPLYMKPLIYLKAAIKWALIDYDNISVNFSQSNSRSGAALKSEATGFSNFWGLTQRDYNGPSRLFMLGLSNDIGPRSDAKNISFSNNFSQSNSVTFKTKRPLWEGASIDLNWKVSWGYNKTINTANDGDGNYYIKDKSSNGKIERSFFSVPFFDTNLKKVNDNYDPNAARPIESLTTAFQEGLETLPLFAKIPLLSEFAKYIPRPNWRITWRGLEKLPLLGSLAKRVSLSHAYTSNYVEGWRLNREEVEEIQTQRISYGFAPLVGLQLSFDEVWGGNLQGNIKFNTKTAYDLQLSTRNVSETFSRDINISASYSKSGFEIPLFGLSLKNDIEVSFNYTTGVNKSTIFEMGEAFDEEGKPQDGTIRTTIEPKVNYTLSSRVKLAVFYKRTTVETEGASKIPPTTTNEAGLEVHISIQ